MSQRRRGSGSPAAAPPASPCPSVGSSRPAAAAGSSTSGPGAPAALSPGWSSSGRLVPMKATVPFQLRQNQQHQSSQSGHGSAAERSSSPSPPVEWVRLLPPSSSSSSSIHRTSSLDALTAPYLAGHWPRDAGHAPLPVVYVKDETTQTDWVDWGEEEEEMKIPHKRSASWGGADHLKEVAKLQQQLQRRKHSSRCHRDVDRKSPFSGSHAVLHQSQAPVSRCVLLSRPVSMATVSRLQSSLERLNQEIERITITHTHSHSAQEEVPDGRRPPPPLHQSHAGSRTVDTQTPNFASASDNHSNDSRSHNHSVSPSFLSATEEESPPCCKEGRETDHTVVSPLPRFSSSPSSSFLFKREPPEGCERVRVFTDQPHHQQCLSTAFKAPDRNKVNFVSNSSSAFSLLTKPSNQLRQ